MFNIGPAELAVIAVVALLVLGPKQLPELARGLGKLLRELRRHTDDVRTVVEREFYRLDHEGPVDAPAKATPAVRGAGEAVPSGQGDEAPLLPPAGEAVRSQLDAGLRREEEPVTVYPPPAMSSAPPAAGAPSSEGRGGTAAALPPVTPAATPAGSASTGEGSGGQGSPLGGPEGDPRS